MIKRKWVSYNADIELISKLVSDTGLDESIIRILLNRGIDTKEKIDDFLNPSLDKLYDPYLLNDMDKAVKRIKEAIKNKESIFIYGDYDVDGVTASSILYLSLKEIYDNIHIYIPERENEGYGLNTNAIEIIKNKGGKLIITVDCGITSIDEAIYAKEIGIDLIITDHHTCPDILPSCVAVINPKRKDSTYPFSELCGAGVTLKLCTALKLLNKKIIALAAIGTIADIVPLILENRIIAHYGIMYLKQGELTNINILSKVIGIDINSINTSTIGFAIAPRINAAGRMASAKKAVELFISEDEFKVTEASVYLDELNKKRQEAEKEILKEAKEYIELNKEYNNDILVVAGKGWQEGVIGIVASRLTEEYYKPCVLISVNDGVGKGSVRSVKGFNIYDALCEVSSYLIKFGGHSLAAGLSIKEENIDAFKNAIREVAKIAFEKEKILPSLNIDCELKEKNIDFSYVENLKKLEPYGMGNSEPVFLIKSGLVKGSYPFFSDKHLKLNLVKGVNPVEAVGFGMGSYAYSLKQGDRIHIACTIGINEYNNIKKIQARIKDVRLEK